MRGDSASKCMRPCLTPPTKIASPSTSSELREDRSDQRGLHDLHQTGAEAERADEQLGQVAERRLQHAGRARAQVRADVLRAARDVHREQRQRDRGARELRTASAPAEVKHGRHDERGAR